MARSLPLISPRLPSPLTVSLLCLLPVFPLSFLSLFFPSPLPLRSLSALVPLCLSVYLSPLPLLFVSTLSPLSLTCSFTLFLPSSALSLSLSHLFLLPLFSSPSPFSYPAPSPIRSHPCPSSRTFPRPLLLLPVRRVSSGAAHVRERSTEKCCNQSDFEFGN